MGTLWMEMTHGRERQGSKTVLLPGSWREKWGLASPRASRAVTPDLLVILCSLRWRLVTPQVVPSEGDSLALRAILWSGWGGSYGLSAVKWKIAAGVGVLGFGIAWLGKHTRKHTQTYTCMHVQAYARMYALLLVSSLTVLCLSQSNFIF